MNIKEFIYEPHYMATKKKYYELIHYGKPVVDVNKQDIDGNFIRIFVFDYYGTKWFMHLENGNIIEIKEL